MASGAAGLIYQVVWTQDLVLVFGNTTQAIVTTVTAFLAGLGIGALVGAAIGARLRRALAVYGLLEVAVGCLALLMPLAFDLIATLFRSAYLSLPPLDVALIRFALAFVALTPVTLLMGMSLPVLTRHLVRADPQVGERIGRLYGLNTLGAVVGSVASGYVLIELLGLRGTTFVAVFLNLGAAGGALLISRTLPKTNSGAAARPADANPRPQLRSRQWLLLGVTFTSGLVSLALEVLWTRVMLQATGSSIYVFVAVVAVFLIGIAAGSMVYQRERRTPRLATLGVLLATAAGLALVALVASNLTGPPSLPAAVLLIFPVTSILGYTFPLTVALFADTAAYASRGVGLVYAANTAGCVIGTVLAGFVLIPVLGTSASIITLCIGQAVIGTVLAIVYTPDRKLFRPAIGLSMTAIAVLLLFVPAARLTYVQRKIAATGEPTAHFEDSAASVDVVGGPARNRELYVNGLGITKLTIDTKLLAYLPKVARPDATSMLNICFGMGSTYRSSIILGMHTTAVELDPTVPSVMSWFYPDANRYLHSPLGHIVIDDGRNYVRLSNKRYDLITIDAPPPIWSAGTVVLMTHEFYQEARQRLNPGGVLTSFIPYAGPVLGHLLLRTLHASFRYVMVVRGPQNYGMFVLGSQSPISLRTSAILKVFGSAAAREDLHTAADYHTFPVTAWPQIIHSHIWMTNNQVSAYTGPGPLLTDDHPLSEYFLIHGIRQGFDPPALHLSLVVTALLALLVIGIGVDALARRRVQPLSGS